MFESMTDRLAGTLLMGLDVAVEFATLGEFRLVEADGPAHDDFIPAPVVRRPARLDDVATDSTLLPPASTAIARAAAESAARAAARRKTARPPLGRSGKATIPSARRRRPATRVQTPLHGSVSHSAKTAPRKRGGAVEAGTQMCLFNR